MNALMERQPTATRRHGIIAGDGWRYAVGVELREFVGLTLSPLRLTLLGRAAEGSLDVSEIAAAHAVLERTVLSELGRLRSAGLIDADNQLIRDTLRTIAMALPQDPPIDPALVGEGWTPEEEEVLARFFSGDRLASIPGVHAKRLVVLERLAQEFDPGVRYPEAEVNFRLQLFYPDYAALRRYLVDEGLMTRADGVYWRTGGRYLDTES